MKVLSFGGGVQTVTLAAMACLDEIERPDFAVFADTQWEKQGTIEYLAWFIPWCAERGLEIITSTKGNIRADALNPSRRFASMPLWTETGYLVHKGKERGALKRQCTNEYKIEVVRKVIRQRSGLKFRQRWKGAPCEEWLGITLDEVERMTESAEAWVRLTYPLIDKRMTRGDCIEWLKKRGIPVPPKSACVGCPFTDNGHWRAMKADSHEEFAAACNFDDAIRRAGPGVLHPVYIHPSLVPLREANLDEAQPDFFMNECAGRCRT